MKQYALIIIIIICCTFPILSQNVNIPDTAFLHALIEEGVDTNEDSLISYAEAEAVTSLDVSGEWICDEDSCWIDAPIESLAGIEAFINLDTLNCRRNNLTSLDVSNNIALEYSYCAGNQLISMELLMLENFL